MTPADASVLAELIRYTDVNATEWMPAGPGGRRKVLHQDERGRRILLVEWEPGFSLPHRDEHHYDEFLYILDGEFTDQNRTSGAGTFIHNEPGSWHQPHTATGCTFLAVISPRHDG